MQLYGMPPSAHANCLGLDQLQSYKIALPVLAGGSSALASDTSKLSFARATVLAGR